MEATFRRTEVPIETRDGKDTQEMDIIEISYPDGKVVAFPADMKSPETGLRYRDMYPGKYQAFKNGEPDPARVSQLEREISERQAELDGMRKAPDDKRVQENLGYGKYVPDDNPHDATKRLPGENPGGIADPVAPLGVKHDEAEQHEPFDQMTKAELHDWISANSSEIAASDANKDELVKLAKKVERKQKANA